MMPLAMKQQPTILLCGPPASAVGGGPTHIRNLHSSPLRQQFKLVDFESGSRGRESPAKDEPTVAKLVRILTSPLLLAWRIVRIRPDVVHINSALDDKAFWRDTVYLLISKVFGRKVLFQLHGGSLVLLCTNNLVRLLVRSIFSLPDAVVLLASSELKDFDEQIGKCDRLSIIANAVDISEYQHPPAREHSGNALRLGFLGRLIRTKGVFEAMRAIELLRADPQFHDVELRIAGSGPEADQIAKYISDRNLAANVKIIGALHGNAKVDFLRQIDLLLFPTYHLEGLPYTILESLAAGTPVISTKIGGIPDVVTDGVHGKLIDNHSAGEVARALRELANSHERLREMSKNCLEWATRQLGLDRLGREFAELYVQVSRPKGQRNNNFTKKLA
jgi:glycosyltransferase involved in cell wall biosynthesis